LLDYISSPGAYFFLCRLQLHVGQILIRIDNPISDFDCKLQAKMRFFHGNHHVLDWHLMTSRHRTSGRVRCVKAVIDVA